MVSGSISSIGMRSPAWAMTSSTRATPGDGPLLAEQGQVDGGSTAPPATSSRPAPSSAPEPHFAVSYQAYVHQPPGSSCRGGTACWGTGLSGRVSPWRQAAGDDAGQVVAPDRLFAIATAEQGMGKLLKGRSDLYVEQTLIASQALAALTRQDPGYAGIYPPG